jgi:twitching motility protein PilJ
MTSGTDYAKVYGEAQTAYLQGNFQEAANIIETIAQEYPEDPNILLLRGHIYLGLGQCSLAEEQYNSVLQLTDQSELVNYARNGLEQIQQFDSQSGEFSANGEVQEELDFENDQENSGNLDHFPHWQEEEEEQIDWEEPPKLEGMDWDDAGEEDVSGEPTLQQDVPFVNPFPNKGKFPSPLNEPLSSISSIEIQETKNKPDANPFVSDEGQGEDEFEINFPQEEVPGFAVTSEFDRMLSGSPVQDMGSQDDYSSNLQIIDNGLLNNVPNKEQTVDTVKGDHQDDTSGNLGLFNEDELEDIPNFEIGDVAQELPASALFSSASGDLSASLELAPGDNTSLGTGLGLGGGLSSGPVGAESMLSPSLISDAGTSSFGLDISPDMEIKQGWLAKFYNAKMGQKELISATITGVSSALIVLMVSFANATIPKESVKPLNQPINQEKTTDKKITATKKTPVPKGETKGQNESITYPLTSRVLLALVAGLSSFAASLTLGQIKTKHLRDSLKDLQQQFDAVYQRNFNVKAKIFSQDELGILSSRFNQMVKVIESTTSSAQKRAEETEREREDLQRQVIRLLDDVEGAARGDLTVQAEVTANVLGAVADAFNLTIQNLREIVKQVKKAAQEVNKGSTESELFARNQSRDALRMAEELAVTLNSVQMMTDSIQRVAESAREAEEVARSSSVTALRGGESVERTVAGILQIRETVSETARKVKRLAEASQEISKIVAVINQVASRTNLLALNASIQAAKAGEAGRGFAIVADEVRQLADRSAKSLEEIEQIVLQIQSETGSVMMAMEEGIQQVLDVTERAEQAKRSLEDIIQVSNRIDALVRSITADTVEQRENSRAVAQVMQSVELTAQETSQESQRVATALLNLVMIARDLLTSVERFRVE